MQHATLIDPGRTPYPGRLAKRSVNHGLLGLIKAGLGRSIGGLAWEAKDQESKG
jgi:hypothetical protein